MLYRLNVWDFSYFQSTILWFALVVPVLFYRIMDTHKNRYSVRKVLLGLIGYSFIIDFLVNSFTFNLIIEMLLIPVATLVLMTMEYARIKDKEYYKDTIRFLSVFNLIIAFAILGNIIWKIIATYDTFFTIATLMDLFIPLVLSILLLPLLLMSDYWIKYDVFWIYMKKNNQISTTGKLVILLYITWKTKCISKKISRMRVKSFSILQEMRFKEIMHKMKYEMNLEIL